MKLIYHKSPNDLRNFGDDLNPWLWGRLIPDLLDEDETTAFIGIGTLLNHRFHQRTPGALRRIIFATGVGYGEHPVSTHPSWHVYALRGPLSAQALGLEPGVAVTDGAFLLRRFYVPPRDRTDYRFAYMPHAAHAESPWREVCDDLGFGYVDARLPVERVLEAISRTEVLITEAMHGAIVADALGIPWIAVSTSPEILAFKWNDWCSSVGLQYAPHVLPPLWPTTFAQPKLLQRARGWAKVQYVRAALRRVGLQGRPLLSRRTYADDLTDELEARLNRVREDLRTGKLKAVVSTKRSVRLGH